MNFLKGDLNGRMNIWAVSASESVIGKVRDYIENQEEHHRTKSFEEEYNLFIKKYGFG